jgi:hypothetical protein
VPIAVLFILTPVLLTTGVLTLIYAAARSR